MSQSDSGGKKTPILVIGSNGQLAHAIRSLHEVWGDNFLLIFASSSELDIRDESQVIHFIEIHQPAVIINCAAYTNVDLAEDEANEALFLNATAAGHLAKAASAVGAIMVHISTDYVFDGLSHLPYKEEDSTHPINVYGQSKLEGERLVRHHCKRHHIIRTSWLYGNHGHNFLNTMLRLANEKSSLNIVSDQISSPTWAADLAHGISQLLIKSQLEKTNIPFGTWHFSNQGEASWFYFANAIFSFAEKPISIYPANAQSYATKAKRPHYSALNCEKWEAKIGAIPHWKVSLLRCLNERRLLMS